MMEAERSLYTLSSEVKAVERELHTLEARLGQIEGALALAHGDVNAIKNTLRSWIETEARALTQKISERGKEVGQCAVVLRSLKNSDELFATTDVLDSVRDQLEIFSNSALLVEDAIDDACERIETSLQTLIESGDEIIEGIVGRCQAFIERADDLSQALNADLGDTLKALAPQELSEAFSTFEQFVSDAENALDNLESQLTDKLGKVTNFVGQVAEVVEPALPLLELVEELA